MHIPDHLIWISASDIIITSLLYESTFSAHANILICISNCKTVNYKTLQIIWKYEFMCVAKQYKRTDVFHAYSCIKEWWLLHNPACTQSTALHLRHRKSSMEEIWPQLVCLPLSTILAGYWHFNYTQVTTTDFIGTCIQASILRPAASVGYMTDLGLNQYHVEVQLLSWCHIIALGKPLVPFRCCKNLPYRVTWRTQTVVGTNLRTGATALTRATHMIILQTMAWMALF